jgi:hypothetical protein
LSQYRLLSLHQQITLYSHFYLPRNCAHPTKFTNSSRNIHHPHTREYQITGSFNKDESPPVRLTVRLIITVLAAALQIIHRQSSAGPKALYPALDPALMFQHKHMVRLPRSGCASADGIESRVRRAAQQGHDPSFKTLHSNSAILA